MEATSGHRRTLIAAAVLAFLIVGWAFFDFVFARESFATVVSEEVRGGEEASEALLRFFGALVLALFVANGIGRRLHWVAAGFVVLGLGHLYFGYLEALIQDSPTLPYEGLYESLLVHTIAGGLLW